MDKYMDRYYTNLEFKKLVKAAEIIIEQERVRIKNAEKQTWRKEIKMLENLVTTVKE